MNLKRLRLPLLAAVSTLVLAGGSVALATDPSTPPSTGTTAVEPGSAGPDTDNVQFEDQNGADDATEAAGAEADATGPDTDNVEFEDQSGSDDAAEAAPAP